MKFIKASYNKESGESVAIVTHMNEIFTGSAKLHPEDKAHASEFRGCSLAETRAMIRALKHERQQLMKEAEICRKFINACSCHKTWDKESPTAKAAYHQLNLKIKAVNKMSDRINAFYAGLIRSIRAQEKVIDLLNHTKKDTK